jgi:hypothetical protein
VDGFGGSSIGSLYFQVHGTETPQDANLKLTFNKYLFIYPQV